MCCMAAVSSSCATDINMLLSHSLYYPLPTVSLLCPGGPDGWGERRPSLPQSVSNPRTVHTRDTVRDYRLVWCQLLSHRSKNYANITVSSIFDILKSSWFSEYRYSFLIVCFDCIVTSKNLEQFIYYAAHLNLSWIFSLFFSWTDSKHKWQPLQQT